MLYISQNISYGIQNADNGVYKVKDAEYSSTEFGNSAHSIYRLTTTSYFSLLYFVTMVKIAIAGASSGRLPDSLTQAVTADAF